MGNKTSQESLSEDIIRQTFESMDSNRSGSLTLDNLTSTTNAIPSWILQSPASLFHFDTTGDGSITLEEFQTLVKYMKKQEHHLIKKHEKMIKPTRKSRSSLDGSLGTPRSSVSSPISACSDGDDISECDLQEFQRDEMTEKKSKILPKRLKNAFQSMFISKEKPSQEHEQVQVPNPTILEKKSSPVISPIAIRLTATPTSTTSSSNAQQRKQSPLRQSPRSQPSQSSPRQSPRSQSSPHPLRQDLFADTTTSPTSPLRQSTNIFDSPISTPKSDPVMIKSSRSSHDETMIRHRLATASSRNASHPWLKRFAATQPEYKSSPILSASPRSSYGSGSMRRMSPKYHHHAKDVDHAILPFIEMSTEIPIRNHLAIQRHVPPHLLQQENEEDLMIHIPLTNHTDAHSDELKRYIRTTFISNPNHLEFMHTLHPVLAPFVISLCHRLQQNHDEHLQIHTQFISWCFRVADVTHDGTISGIELRRFCEALTLDGIAPRQLCYTDPLLKKMPPQPPSHECRIHSIPSSSSSGSDHSDSNVNLVVDSSPSLPLEDFVILQLLYEYVHLPYEGNDLKERLEMFNKTPPPSLYLEMADWLLSSSEFYKLCGLVTRFYAEKWAFRLITTKQFEYIVSLHTIQQTSDDSLLEAHVHTEKQLRIYQIWSRQLLGRGASGARICQATCCCCYQNVAIKFMPLRLFSSSSHSPRKHSIASQGTQIVCGPPIESHHPFQIEMNILFHLSHPNIIRLYEVIETEKHICLVMELCQGGSLQDYLIGLDQSLPIYMSKSFIYQICSALLYCHTSGVSHRDLSLPNLLLSEHGQIKIADFGHANNFTNVASDTFKNHHEDYQSMGNMHYLSPEQVSQSTYEGTKRDAWSLGILLYMLTVGQLPFIAENHQLLFEKIRSANLMFPSNMSKELIDLIQSLLCLNPEKRCALQSVLNHPWMQSVNPQQRLPYWRQWQFEWIPSSSSSKESTTTWQMLQQCWQLVEELLIGQNIHVHVRHALPKRETEDIYQVYQCKDDLTCYLNVIATCRQPAHDLKFKCMIYHMKQPEKDEEEVKYFIEMKLDEGNLIAFRKTALECYKQLKMKGWSLLDDNYSRLTQIIHDD